MKPINKLLCCAAGVVTALCIDIQAMEQTAGGGGSPAHPISFNVHEYNKKYLEIAKIQFLSLEGTARDALTALEKNHNDLVAVNRIIDERLEGLGFSRAPDRYFEVFSHDHIYHRYVLYESQFKEIKDEHKSVVAATATIDTILNFFLYVVKVINNKEDHRWSVGRERWNVVDQVLRSITERQYLDDTPDPVTPRAPVIEYFLKEIGEIK